ncbi:MAG: DUF1559 domain-containing protein, partial [Planctomycetales bacterium]|nr:DUF1559 domain-containing protein [Planctomycetales bacterium]
AYTVDDDGNPLHSWRTQLLPYLEQHALYDQIRQEEPWDSANNFAYSSTPMPLFKSPRDPNSDPTLTSYVVVVGADTLFSGGAALGMHDVQDGMSGTILAIEIHNSDIAWAEPRDVLEEDLAFVSNGADPLTPNVVPQSGAVLMGDGSVLRFGPETTPEMWRAMLSHSGGEAVERP